MKITWTSHLKTKEEKEEFEKEVRSARKVLKRLQDILQEDYDISDKEMHKRENFFMPAWAEKQAFELGYQKAHKKTINLLEV
jgi:glutamate/tyrosine decarboxylase-like PLP-dependent enzyme